MKLLLVEDDIEAGRAMMRGLGERGHEVALAFDGHEGLQQALDDEYDLIITNRLMPKMDGLTLIRALRDGGIDTPIFVVSALGEVEDRVAGFNAGADDYLVKPYAFSELEARVLALGRRSRRPRDPADQPPKLPTPRRSIHFALNTKARLAPVAPDASPETIDNQTALLPHLRTVVDEIVEQLSGSNAYTALSERLKTYQRSINPSGLSDSNIDEVYATGVRAEGAYAQALTEIDKEELPRFSGELAERLESCFALHNVILGSSPRGRELLETARAFSDRVLDLRQLQYQTRRLAIAVSKADDLFAPETRSMIAEAGDQIEAGPHRQRPNESAFSTVHNLLLGIGRLALRNPIGTGLAAEVILHTVPGGMAVDGLAGAINLCWNFLILNKEALLGLVLAAGPDLFWLQMLVRWVERKSVGTS